VRIGVDLQLAILVAPIGVWLLQFVPTHIVWWIYVGVLLFLAYRMAFPPKMDDSKALTITDRTRVTGGLLSAAITCLNVPACKRMHLSRAAGDWRSCWANKMRSPSSRRKRASETGERK